MLDVWRTRTASFLRQKLPLKLVCPESGLHRKSCLGFRGNTFSFAGMGRAQQKKMAVRDAVVSMLKTVWQTSGFPVCRIPLFILPVPTCYLFRTHFSSFSFVFRVSSSCRRRPLWGSRPPSVGYSDSTRWFSTALYMCSKMQTSRSAVQALHNG